MYFREKKDKEDKKDKLGQKIRTERTFFEFIPKSEKKNRIRIRMYNNASLGISIQNGH